MADALISPTVGGALWVATGGLLAYCARNVKRTLEDRLVPMMGVLGAFVFTAQMINFTIPGTGSSGHLGGGLLLAALLGPHAAFLVIASVLTVQAFFFMDGGLLALGCNIFNLGFYPAFVAYPFLYRTISGGRYVDSRAWVAAIVASVVGLQLGAFSVVLETMASGVSGLPFGAFILLMLPIHLAIGVVEGVATAAVVSFVARARPEALRVTSCSEQGATASLRSVAAGLLVVAAVTGGALSWFASTRPDGLEWSIEKIAGTREVPREGQALSTRLAALQEKTALMPEYGFKTSDEEAAEAETAVPWPAVQAGTSVSGLVGGLFTLVLVCCLGLVLKSRRTAA